MDYRKNFFYILLATALLFLPLTALKFTLQEKGAFAVPTAFWVEKVYARADKDIIAIGDSRIYRGISSKPFLEHNPHMNVLNFGFNSAGFSKAFLNDARNKLREDGKKIIFIGVTPHSLTDIAARNESYHEYASEEFMIYKDISAFEKALAFIFGRDSTASLINFYIVTKNYIEIPHNDGWVESASRVEDVQPALQAYKDQFSQYQISPDIVQNFIDFIKDSTEKGYRVYCVRPPTIPAMEKIENELSGFDEEKTKAAIRNAGGIWLDLPEKQKYHSYDGSHLRGDSAVEFSKDVAKVILQEK